MSAAATASVHTTLLVSSTTHQVQLSSNPCHQSCFSELTVTALSPLRHRRHTYTCAFPCSFFYPLFPLPTLPLLRSFISVSPCVFLLCCRIQWSALWTVVGHGVWSRAVHWQCRPASYRGMHLLAMSLMHSHQTLHYANCLCSLSSNGLTFVSMLH